MHDANSGRVPPGLRSAWLASWAAVAALSLSCARQPVVLAQPRDSTGEDAAADAADLVGTDAATTDQAVPTATDASPDVAAAPTVRVHLSAAFDFSGPVTVSLTPASNPPGFQALQDPDAVVCGVSSGSLPALVQCALPPGSWYVLAVSMATPKPVGAMACVEGAPLVVENPGTPALHDVDLVLHAPGSGGGAPCSAGQPTKSAQVALAQLDYVATPPTAAGGPHLLYPLTWQDRMWVAGSQDGFVSFDFPPPPSQPVAPLANWATHGKPFCTRLQRYDSTLFCSNRTSKLQALTLQPGTQDVVSDTQPALTVATAEGMAASNGLLYVAAHGAGLAALSTEPPFAPKSLEVPVQLTDSWDVAVVGPDRLAVADGANGLAILDVSGTKALAPQVVATLPLAGRSAFLHAAGPLLAVGALGGGLHVVSITNPDQPELLASAHPPGDVYGVLLHQDRVLAATGHHIIAYALPSPGQGELHAVGALATHHFALGLAPFGQAVASAEFESVRRLQIVPQVVQSRVLLAPQNLFAAATKAGDTLKAGLTLANLGTDPLHVKQLRYYDVHGGPAIPVPGPAQIGPGETVTLPIAVTKVAKGVTVHEIVFETDDPAQPSIGMNLEEITWLLPGDTLPLVQYQDAGGTLHDVNAAFQGKVGVLLVAAHTCPVAFLALASAGTALGPLLQQGKIAAYAVDPWTKGDVPEVQALTLPFPRLYSPKTTQDGHDSSEVLDVKLGQPVKSGPPMPIVYVVGKDGKLVLATWGWESQRVLAAVQAALAAP